MWEFVKSAPWTWAVGALIFVSAIVGVVWGVVRHHDRGFMKRGTNTLQWGKSDIPLKIKYTRQVHSTYVELAKLCTAQLNNRLGKLIFDPVLDRYEDSGNLTKIDVLLDKLDIPFSAVEAPDGSVRVEDNVGGRTDVYDNAGRIVLAKVLMPDPAKGWANGTMLTHLRHELGHALGLDHDDKKDSVMHQVSEQRTKDFTASDLDRLKKTYL